MFSINIAKHLSKSNLFRITISLLVLFVLTISDAHAQAARSSQARTGSFGRTSMPTGRTNQTLPSSYTRNQSINRLPRTGFGSTAVAYGRTGRNGLPPTTMDSFVLNAGAYADAIYGDEGVDLPPFFEYTKAHRINRGIVGDRDAGLTTGHGSYLPDASGGDEFVDGPEWSESGANYGQPLHSGPDGFYEHGPEATPGLYAFSFDHGLQRDVDPVKKKGRKQ